MSKKILEKVAWVFGVLFAELFFSYIMTKTILLSFNPVVCLICFGILAVPTLFAMGADI